MPISRSRRFRASGTRLLEPLRCGRDYSREKNKAPNPEGGSAMIRRNRRDVLKFSAAGALATATGGMAGILASGRAPAYAQATTVHWLRWNDFVPASDQLLKKEIAAECEKALGVKLNIETINGND